MPDSQPMKIKVEPTKELFVHILTRDIAHHAAITELLDNSVDGAKRIAQNAEDLSSFWVNVDFNRDKFAIEDNCGGIPLDIARDYAFRFGRPEGMQKIPGSIGQFGVGMKRALFSFGRKYLIESATNKDWFRLEIDRDAWMKEEGWDFDLNEYGENNEGKSVGTRIEVTELHPNAANQFALDYFRTRVENEIKQKHRLFISRGLAVKVCGVTIPSEEWQLFSDGEFRPEYREKTYNGSGTEPVRVRIYAGVGRSNPSDAGWYVICNGRLILSAEKSEKTGWDWQSSAETDATGETPRYHNQFARFRGYALFDSDDAGRLPWNTMKTDVDPDDPIWLDARETMASVMRPVVDFLNLLASETELPQEERLLTSALSTAKVQPIGQIRNQQRFQYPANPRPPRPKSVTIQFRKEKERIDALQDAMGTSSARETGDAAFEEAYKRYVQDGE